VKQVSVREPEVSTAYGRVRGRERDGVAVFLGLPYARPPVGERRFAAPVPPERWDGAREAAQFGPAAPQSELGFSLAGAAKGDEWLTLNVWTPDPSPGAELPVFVWVHGGAYRSEASSSPAYDGTLLAKLGLVVVTCNYRLGVEGFAQLAGAPANRALLDVVAVLQWVAANVGSFGGSPSKVTVAGESAGAGIVAALLAMPSAKGLFRGAIAQSVPGTFFSPELAADISREIAAEAGAGTAEPGPPRRDHLAAIPPERLTAAADAVSARMRWFAPRWGPVAHTVTPFSPVVDGEVLPLAPWRAMLAGAARDVRLLTGHNRDEYRVFMGLSGKLGKVTDEEAAAALEVFAPSPPKFRFAYSSASPDDLYERVMSDWLFRMPSLHLAQTHAVSGGTSFLYELTCAAPASPALGACHALDVPLVFGVVAEGITGFIVGASPPPSFTELGDFMRSEWAAFVRDGTPGWQPYTAALRLTRVYDVASSLETYPEERSMHLWERHVFDALPLT
jgi:para-nitrobenzyl esterase